MSAEIGLALDERIRRALEPLGGALRVDTFVSIVARERARRASEQAKKMKPRSSREESGFEGSGEQPAFAFFPDAAGIPAGDPSNDLSDSAKVKTEIASFLKREDPGGVRPDEVHDFLRKDEVRDASKEEVAEYMDFLGPTALSPTDQSD